MMNTCLRVVLLIVSLASFSHMQSQELISKNKLDSALVKAGNNRGELEKAIVHFQHEKDSLKLEATYFLISNMDIHSTKTHYWRNADGKKIDFNEFDYPNFKEAALAFDSIKQSNNGLLYPQDTIISDIKTISGQYLIDNINKAFESWQQSKYKNISFQDFCELILPYKITSEPIENWRQIYSDQYKWISDSLRTNSIRKVLEYIAFDYKFDFKRPYGEVPGKPISNLGGCQLLFRKYKIGKCENIASLGIFQLRSQGIPASLDMIPLWATSFGLHYLSTVFDENMRPIRFSPDMDLEDVGKYELMREPAKVVRFTYSKQTSTLAMGEEQENIPPGFMQLKNYIDVSQDYWETADISMPLFPIDDIKVTTKDSVIDNNSPIFACMFSLAKWNAIWWGKRTQDSATFDNMPKGTVILPMYYKDYRLIPGYPNLFRTKS